MSTLKHSNVYIGEKVIYRVPITLISTSTKPDKIDLLLTEGNIIFDLPEPIKVPLNWIDDFNIPMIDLVTGVASGNLAQIDRVHKDYETSEQLCKLTYHDEVNTFQEIEFSMIGKEARSFEAELNNAKKVTLSEAEYANRLRAESQFSEYFGVRLGAFVLDFFFWNIIWWLLTGIVHTFLPFSFLWLAAIVSALYFIGFWTWWGKTPGMAIVGMEVVTKNGASIGLRRALIRYLGYLVCIATLGIGSLMIEFSNRNAACMISWPVPTLLTVKRGIK